jgi:hypothetical protein
MTKRRTRVNRLALLVICSFGVLAPTVSFANLNSIACRAIWRGCRHGCHTDQCIDDCNYSVIQCLSAGLNKQQTPPPPCTGVRCSLPVHNPPTTVSDPNPPPRRPVAPVTPVKPVGVSNPNKPTTGEPVIMLRKNDSGGQGHGHH